jgi:hypothetical protein
VLKKKGPWYGSKQVLPFYGISSVPTPAKSGPDRTTRDGSAPVSGQTYVPAGVHDAI